MAQNLFARLYRRCQPLELLTWLGRPLLYWWGAGSFGEAQAERYYNVLMQRFDEIVASPYKYPAVDHIREGYRRSVCGVNSIYYQVNGKLVEVMRILGRQDVGEQL